MRRERDEEFIRHDCKDRIAKLETLLEQSSKEKDKIKEYFDESFIKYDNKSTLKKFTNV